MNISVLKGQCQKYFRAKGTVSQIFPCQRDSVTNISVPKAQCHKLSERMAIFAIELNSFFYIFVNSKSFFSSFFHFDLGTVINL